MRLICFGNNWRQGVSKRCPEGTEWIHVKNDVKFQSISIGEGVGNGGVVKVWAIGKDGSAFLRHGISDITPTGMKSF